MYNSDWRYSYWRTYRYLLWRSACFKAIYSNSIKYDFNNQITILCCTYSSI